jgi:hypothetical protein
MQSIAADEAVGRAVDRLLLRRRAHPAAVRDEGEHTGDRTGDRTGPAGP